MQGGHGFADSGSMKHRSSNLRISKGQFACYLLTLLISAGGVANAQNSPGLIRGSIVTIESDGSRSMIPGATVIAESAEGARQTTADNVGSYSLRGLARRPIPDPSECAWAGRFSVCRNYLRSISRR